jgi:hypothetical protein
MSIIEANEQQIEKLLSENKKTTESMLFYMDLCAGYQKKVETLQSHLINAVAVLKSNSSHHRECNDSDEVFSADETCECGAIAIQHLVADIEKDIL